MAEQTSAAIRLPVAFIEELSRAASIEQVLAAAAGWLPDILDADRARLSFVDGERIISRSHRRDGLHDLNEDVAPFDPGDPREQVLQGGAPLQMGATDMARDTSPAVQALYDKGLRTMLQVPLQTADMTVGVITLLRRDDRPFTGVQIRMLTAAGSWIAGQARLMQQLRLNARLAETDPLTGLANRTRLMRVLDGPGDLHRPDSQGRVVGVLHVDLDNFKEINDRMGHAAGDALLRHAAQVMLHTAGPTDLVARIGGDEFVIVTRSDRYGRHLARLALHMADRLAAPTRIAGTDTRCPASIGTALAGPNDTSADRLIANADLALYEVKRRGRGGVHAFTQELRTRYEARCRLHDHLRAAVEAETFEPYFQPIVDSGSGDTVAIEAMLRWPHPEGDLLSPDDFSDAAREIGLTSRIDAILRRKSLIALGELHRAGWTRMILCLNMPAPILADPDLAETLLWDVLGHGLAPGDLALEVAGPQIAADSDGRVRQQIAQLIAKGFSVDVDEFGTAHGTMPRLDDPNFRGVKVSDAMTVEMPARIADSVLATLFAVANELGLVMTSHDVDTTEGLARHTAENCHRLQGAAIAPPMAFDALVDYLRRPRQQQVTLVAG